MSESVLLLGNTLKKQNEILTELLDIILKQRDALKEGRHADLQTLMSELRHVSVRCQAIETKRARTAEELAGALGCEPTVSEILRALPEGSEESAEGRSLIEEESKKLIQIVQRLKIEMSLISRLMDEAKSLNEMLISEWQKLSLKAIGGAALGTFDAKI
ncbi:flagellar protein FlgN [Synergistaceae bacterium OttesenSCG-928-I11]|nr:flagellar protein FlgN [Synergistaceae bacterium OttesenSCG-928-I11]